jgi:ADP-heptose:LPS heptosyltransferase
VVPLTRICAGRSPFYLRPFFHQELRGLLVDPHEAARDHAISFRNFQYFIRGAIRCGLLHREWILTDYMVEPQKYLVIHPGASQPSQILEIDKWAQATRQLIADGLIERVVVSAGPASEERIMAEALCGLIGPAAFSTRGQLTLAQLAKLLQEARLFMGTDSAVLQLASAVKVPVLGVYGPSDYNRSRPWGTLSRSVRIDTTMFEGEDLNDYNNRMNRAMGRITAQQIFRAADDLLRISKA